MAGEAATGFAGAAETAAQRVAATEAATAIGLAAKGLELAKAKAYLYVRVIGGEMQDSTGANTSEEVDALKHLIKRRKKKSKEIAKRAGMPVDTITITTEGVENMLSETETQALMMSAGFLPMEVQYNPMSLQMQTVGGTLEKYTAMGNDTNNSLVATDKQTSTYLTVQLIFEDINVDDAFGNATHENGIASGVSNTADQVVSAVTTGLSDGYSVRRQVEGIISLLMLKRTRQVIFVWNNMFFHGELLSVDANFTMFNKLGHPIRAMVNMQIQQSNNNATFKSDLEYWDEVLDTVFS